MFNEEERKLALARLDADQTVDTLAGGKKEKTTWSLIGRGFNFNVSRIVQHD